MKIAIAINVDEYYPFHTVQHVDSEDDANAAIDAKTYKRWCKVMDDFEEVQDEMEEALEKYECLREKETQDAENAEDGEDRDHREGS